MSSLLLLVAIVIPPFLGTYCIGLTQWLSEIWDMTARSSHFIIFFLTTSFITEFSLHWHCTDPVCLSSNRILCKQYFWTYALDVHECPSYSLAVFFQNLQKCFFIWCTQLEEIITGSMLFFPKWAYFKYVVKVFSSKISGSSSDCFVFLVSCQHKVLESCVLVLKLHLRQLQVLRSCLKLRLNIC